MCQMNYTFQNVFSSTHLAFVIPKMLKKNQAVGTIALVETSTLSNLAFFKTGISFFIACSPVYLCVYEHTHAHCTWGIGCETSGWDETVAPGGLEESRWTKSRHKCIRTCLQSTPVNIHAVRRDEIWTDCFFLTQNIFVFREIKAKDVNLKVEPKTRSSRFRAT